jgi:excinuclease ABC subunit B
MYADKITDSMKRALDETNRRRKKQETYNQVHGIEPASIIKAVHDITERLTAPAIAESKAEYRVGNPLGMPRNELKRLVTELESQMKQAAKDLEFERAAALRDQIYEMRAIMADDTKLTPFQRVRLMSGEDE